MQRNIAKDTPAGRPRRPVATEDRLSAFSQRLDSMTSEFRETGSLSHGKPREEPSGRQPDDSRPGHDMAALDGNIRHVIALLDDEEHRFYATRHSH